jgi:hypothetical protein
MRYESPSLPVDLTLIENASSNQYKSNREHDGPILPRTRVDIPLATNSLTDTQTDGNDSHGSGGNEASDATTEEEAIVGAPMNQKPKARQQHQQQQQQLPTCFDASIAFQELVAMYSSSSNNDNRTTINTAEGNGCGSSNNKSNATTMKEKEN